MRSNGVDGDNETYRQSHDNQVTGDMEPCIAPPDGYGLAVDRLGPEQAPVPECFERDACRAGGRNEPNANSDDESDKDLDRFLGPAVGEDALVQQQDGQPGEDETERVEEDAVPRSLCRESVNTSLKT